MTLKYEPPTTPARTTRGSPSPISVNSMTEKSPNSEIDLRSRLEVANLRDREVGVLRADAAGRLTDVDEAVLVAVGERPQQHAADDAENGGVGADAERERQDDGEGQSLDPDQGPRRVPEICDKFMGSSGLLLFTRRSRTL